ncbi:MAG TPA: CHAD domain-containing protein [Candidatus Limnocylindrales bacterium]|nr:CHAD domain-containing protein [Candidatus Limnocylindrales bacterium]
MTEIELKYRVGDLAAAERLLAADRLGPFTGGAGRARATQLEDRYVDTADGALARAGFAVRLRQSGGETIVSVKALAHAEGSDGAMHREELEGPADRVAPPVDWPASDAKSLVVEHAGDAPLVERVTIRQLRRKRQLRSASTRVELSLDEVDVVERGRVVERFVELEAELTKGEESELAALGAAIESESGLRRARTSKLEAALAAINGSSEGAATPASGSAPASAAPPAPAVPPVTEPSGEDAPRLVVGKSPGVLAEDNIAEAGRKVMRFHLARMLDREPGVRSGIDIEDVHKMRVATRRQRAAWRVFGEAYRQGRTKAYRQGLRDIARRLGAVRDLDVQLEATDHYREDLPRTEQRALEPLIAAWRQHRDDARDLLTRELDSPGYGRFIDDYLDFVRTDGAAVAPIGATQPHRVRDTAPSRIWAAYEQVRSYEPVLRWADVPTLHELRIAGKWLRYSMEFVAEPLGDDALPLIGKVTALQDHLGLMNDADVSASMARTFLVEHAEHLSQAEGAAIGRYLVDREREVARLRRAIGVPWRGIAGPGFRRSLGRVVAGL